MDGMVFYKHHITDDQDQGAAMSASLRDAAGFIHKALSGGGSAVVHCAAGASRSATVVLAYLVIHDGQPLRQAFGKLWAARPCTWPNDGFMEALINLEKEVSGGASSISIEEYIEWGDYDGPAADAAEEEPTRRPLPRLCRMPTNLGAEMLASSKADAPAEAEAAKAAEEGEAEEEGAPLIQRESSLSRSEREERALEASIDARMSRRTMSGRWSEGGSFKRSEEALSEADEGGEE